MEVPSINDQIRTQITEVFQMQQEYAPQLVHTTAKERLEKLERIERYLRDEGNMKRLFEVMHQDLRKPEVEVIASETGVIESHIKHVRSYLKRWMAPKKVPTPMMMIGTSSYIYYEPKGVSLIMAPWNYPLNLALVPVVYALAAGNTVILKPSEISRHTSAYIKQMIEELYDEREVAVFEGDASVAKALLDQPFNHIYFTGSPQIGKVVMKAAAEHLASVTLELGGKSPAIVDPSASLATIAERTVWSKSINAGQTCIAPDYLIVHESVKEKFVEEYRRAVHNLFDPKGEGVQASPDYCRIISDKHFQRLNELLDDALDKGAEVAVGGQRDEGHRFIAPTLLTGITEEMEVMEEEIFGPLMPLLTYRERKEIVDIVRRRPKPLTMYIASKNKDNIRYLLENTSAGGTIINEFLLGYSNPHLPFGGVNNSGIGKSLGHHGFVEFSNERGVIKRNWGTLKFIYPPYTDWIRKTVERVYKWF